MGKFLKIRYTFDLGSTSFGTGRGLPRHLMNISPSNFWSFYRCFFLGMKILHLLKLWNKKDVFLIFWQMPFTNFGKKNKKLPSLKRTASLPLKNDGTGRWCIFLPFGAILGLFSRRVWLFVLGQVSSERAGSVHSPEVRCTAKDGHDVVGGVFFPARFTGRAISWWLGFFRSGLHSVFFGSFLEKDGLEEEFPFNYGEFWCPCCFLGVYEFVCCLVCVSEWPQGNTPWM